MSRSRNVAGRSAAAARASAMNGDVKSIPVIRWPRRARGMVMRPFPHGTSSTRDPGRSPSTRSIIAARASVSDAAKKLRCTSSHSPEKNDPNQSGIAYGPTHSR